MSEGRYWRLRDCALEEAATLCENSLRYLSKLKRDGKTLDVRTEAYYQSKCAEQLMWAIRNLKVGAGEAVADVKGQVDWQAVAARALNKTGADSWTHDKCEEALRTTFEPLVRAALIAQADNYALAGTREALRAALNDLPKVGG